MYCRHSWQMTSKSQSLCHSWIKTVCIQLSFTIEWTFWPASSNKQLVSHSHRLSGMSLKPVTPTDMPLFETKYLLIYGNTFRTTASTLIRRTETSLWLHWPQISWEKLVGVYWNQRCFTACPWLPSVVLHFIIDFDFNLVVPVQMKLNRWLMNQSHQLVVLKQ